MTEIWKDVKDYEKYYQISNFGKVRSKNRITRNGSTNYIKKGKILKSFDNGLGYKFVCLKKGGKSLKMYIHRLVGMHFIENPLNKPYINHIDCNPSNNRVENLEWCTPKENTRYMFKLGRQNMGKEWKEKIQKYQEKRRKKVVSLNLKTNEEKIYNYLNEVKIDGHSPGEVCKCCKNDKYTHHGLKWRYLDDRE